jgi:hypothetical protein
MLSSCRTEVRCEFSATAKPEFCNACANTNWPSIQGDTNMLFDSKQAPLLSEIRTWPEFGNLKAHVSEYEKKLLEIETAQGVLAKKEKVIKAEFARGLSHGFK